MIRKAQAVFDRSAYFRSIFGSVQLKCFSLQKEADFARNKRIQLSQSTHVAANIWGSWSPRLLFLTAQATQWVAEESARKAALA